MGVTLQGYVGQRESITNPEGQNKMKSTLKTTTFSLVLQ